MDLPVSRPRVVPKTSTVSAIHLRRFVGGRLLTQKRGNLYLVFLVFQTNTSALRTSIAVRGGCMGPNLSSTLEPDMAAGPSRILPLSSRYIRFGPFQVDQQRQEVSKNGTRLRLQCKVYQVLLALIEKQGEVVTRDELRVRLWPSDTHVNFDPDVHTTQNKLHQPTDYS